MSRIRKTKPIYRLLAVGLSVVLCTLLILSVVAPLPVTPKFLSIGWGQQAIAQEPAELVGLRDATSKVFFLGYTEEGRAKYALDTHIGAIHYKDGQGDWQDIDVTYEEADSGNFTVKFSKVYYFGRIGDDSGRRIYPNRNDLSYWIQFEKPFANMPAPTRSDRWFYWNFAHAIMGIRFDPTSVKFGFRLKDSEAPTSITMPFTSQGLTRDGRFLYHNEECVGELRRPWAIDANNVTRDCEITFGIGEVTVSLDTTGLIFPIDIDPTLDLQVGANLDDVYEMESTGMVVDGNAITHKSSTSAATRVWGAHRWVSGSFPSVGSTITVAYAQLYVYGISTDDANINGHFEKAASPAQFTTNDYDVTGRTRTTASVSWIANSLGTGWKQTPSLVTPLQEVIDSYSPTALALIFRPNQDAEKNLATRAYNFDTSLAAKLHIEWTAGCSPSIELNQSSWSVNGGSPITEGSNYTTGITWCTITNNSGGAVTITIGGTDMTGGGYTWDLSDDGSAGDMIYGLYSGLDDEDDTYDVVVKESTPYNTLVSGLADEGTQDFGLKIYIPTNFDDGNAKSGPITLTTVCD